MPYYKIINKKKRFLTALADVLGYCIWAPINLLRRTSEIASADVKRILVIRTAYVGDVVMTLPMLKPLKELYPDAEITFLTSSAASDIPAGNPCVTDVLTYDAFWFYPKGFAKAIGEYFRFLKVLRSRQYDLVIEARADIRDILLLAYAARSRYRISYGVGGGGYLLTHTVPFRELKHKVDYHLDIARFLGAKTDGIEWGLSVGPTVRDTAGKLLAGGASDGSSVLVGIHPAGRMPLKCWEPSRFASLADELISGHGARVFFTGSAGQRALVDDIILDMAHEAENLAGRTTLPELAAIIDELDLFVCNDTAALHIASAMKTPCVAIFGPSKSMETGPYGNVHRVVEKDFPCRYDCDESTCHWRLENECMTAICVADVLEAATTVLAEAKNEATCNGV